MKEFKSQERFSNKNDEILNLYFTKINKKILKY
jgi:hypothetical protein